MIQPPQLAVDLYECFYRIRLVLDFVRVSHDFRNNFLNQAVLERKLPAAKCFWKDFVPELRGGFISSGIASDHLHWRVHRPIVFEGEQREAKLLVTLGRISWKEVRPDLNSGNFCIIGNAIYNALRAALIDIVLSRNHLQPRRFDVEHKIFGDVFSISFEEMA